MSATVVRRRDGTQAERKANDAYYTPQALADAAIERLWRRWALVGDVHVIEPSAGGGSWVQALPHEATVDAWDIDPAAPGLAFADRGIQGDWLAALPGVRADAILGNPPYSEALEHVIHALRRAPRVAFLLRLGFLGGAKRNARLAAVRAETGHRLTGLHVCVPRPSFTGGGTDSADYAVFEWTSVQMDAGTAVEPLLWRAHG